MSARLSIAICFGLWSCMALGNTPASPGLIGILGVIASEQTSDEPAFAAPIEVRSEPTPTGPVIGSIRDFSEVESYEWSYEQPGLGVFGYLHDGTETWYRIRLKAGSRFGWLNGRPAFTFRGLSELLTSSLAYLTGHWDKAVYLDARSPDSATQLQVEGDEIPIEVATASMIDGKLWLLVVVLKESQCGAAQAPPVAGAGWVPAVSSDGHLNAWFYSRGC